MVVTRMHTLSNPLAITRTATHLNKMGNKDDLVLRDASKIY